MSCNPIDIADILQRLEPEIIERWRAEVRVDSEQYPLVHHLDDQELQDHLPALTAQIIKLLRGEAAVTLEEDAAEHGRNRRALGFSVIPLMHELQIFRKIFVAAVEESINAGVSNDAIKRARQSIVDIIDRSMNISVSQYIAAAEEERNSARGEARELHEQRDRFLVTLSHELRNQISPILLGVQLLKGVKSADPLIAQTVERIERQARHQSILIDDLLDMSRFRYGKLQLRRENLDLRVPVRHAIETLQNDFAAKHLKLEIRLPERPLIAFADGTRIAQVLINLLNNALKFTPPNGTISLELTEQAGSAVIAVRDNGVGISPAMLPQVFRMFYQAEAVSPPVKTGLGIGLALARILVEMHEGSIEAYSAGEGQGAEFTVQLPLASIPAAERTSTKRVLLVDDNPDHLHLLALALKLKGYEIVTAGGGAEALHRAAEDRPYACIIDIGLPDINGYEVARRLRSLPQTQDTRLIAVTGYGTLADKQLYKEAGFDHYLIKPPNLDQLIQALN